MEVALEVIDRIAPTLSTEQVARVLRLLSYADSAELKLSVAEDNRRSVVEALGMDPLDAQLRQVAFFDTPDLVLDRSGVVVRARRVQSKSGDTVVKLRPLDPPRLPAEVRSHPGFSVEIDAMPGGFMCSGALKSKAADAAVRESMNGRRSLRTLLSKDQRGLLAAYAPDGLSLDHLAVLGPINVLKLRFTPAGFPRRFVAELWNYPDGSRVLELSTKCATTEAFEVAAETRSFLEGQGVEVGGEQITKTRRALTVFAAELAAPEEGSAP